MANYIAPASFPAGVKLGSVVAASATSPASGELLLVSNASDSSKLYTKNASGEVVAGGLWEISNGYLQPIPSVSSYVQRMGCTETSFPTAASAFNIDTKGASLTYSAPYYQNDLAYGASILSGKLATSLGGWRDASNYPQPGDLDKVTDGSTAYTTWEIYRAMEAGMQIDAGSSKIPRRLRFYFQDIGGCAPSRVRIASSPTGSGFTDLYDSAFPISTTGWYTIDFNAGETSGRYFQIYWTNPAQIGRGSINEVELLEASYASTNNTVDTYDIATGENFAPATFKVFDETYNGNGSTGLIAPNAGAYNVAFKRINSSPLDFGTLISGIAFQAISPSDFSGCSELKFRIQPVGAQKIGGISISTTSVAVLVDPAGSITGNINGVDVWETTSEGDVTAVDMVVNSVSASGEVNGKNYFKSTPVESDTTTVTIDQVLVDEYDSIAWEAKAVKGAAKKVVIIRAAHDGTASADASNTVSTGELAPITLGTIGATFSVDTSGSGTSQYMRLRGTSTENDVYFSAKRITI